MPIVLLFLGGALIAALLARKSGSSASPIAGLLAEVKNQGAPFAAPTGSVWPVITSNPNRLLVPYLGFDGKIHTSTGAAGGNRHFAASRQDGQRKHAAIDLVADAGDPIVAAEKGKVLGWIPGYGIGADLRAVAIEQGDKVAIYAEIAPESGIEAGSIVSAGQRIGTGAKNSSGNSMLHFELWTKDRAPRAYTPWWSKDPAPAGLLDPTRYLLALAGARGG